MVERNGKVHLQPQWNLLTLTPVDRLGIPREGKAPAISFIQRITHKQDEKIPYSYTGGYHARHGQRGADERRPTGASYRAEQLGSQS